MESSLNPYEARVLGVLIEKSFTTPDQYPLSLNATTNACNQKSCRKPVVDFTEAEVLVTLKGLRMKHLGGGSIPAGSRVERWHHSAREHWSLGDGSLAVLAELLLRGAQSASALRSNSNRMSKMAGPAELDQALEPLLTANMVRIIPAGQGSRVAQWVQTLTGEAEPPTLSPQPAPMGRSLPTPSRDMAPTQASPPASTLSELESRVANLESQLKSLAEKLGETL